MTPHEATRDKDDSFPHADQVPAEKSGAEGQSPLQTPHTESSRDSFSMNAVIGWILQGGVLISSAVICVGVALWLIRTGQRSDQQFLTFPHTLGEVGSGLLQLKSQSIIALGLLLLLATPVVRVAASIVAFALEHDRRYVIITTIVLAILLLSFFLGKGAG